ncbi:hypothetical protein VNO77_44631 [Canavalia gladiata]|uniref:Uncharacterized protein n=1 Tax=Canavalia gladiata TaxID=3824 RepID=A0AAN9PQK6_CANGL
MKLNPLSLKLGIEEALSASIAGGLNEFALIPIFSDEVQLFQDISGFLRKILELANTALIDRGYTSMQDAVLVLKGCLTRTLKCWMEIVNT